MKSRELLQYTVVVLLIVCLHFLTDNAYGLSESTGPGGSNAQQVHDVYGQTGQGIKVGIMSVQNVYLPHQAFWNTTIHNMATTGLSTDPNWHDTMLAGVLASDPCQVSRQYQKGAAPGIEIYSMRVGNILEALQTLIDVNDCRVIVTGFQLSTGDADGNSFTTLMYDYYACQQNIIFATGAGNKDARYPSLVTISVPGDAYNGITTGGIILNDPLDQTAYRRIGSSSLPGPTDDNRKKPDVAAPSAAQTVPSSGGYNIWSNTDGPGGTTGATSWAAPHTAGISALLLGLADSTAGEPDDNMHQVIKAVIVNSTFGNITDSDGNPTTGDVFNFNRGYGRVDALRAYETLSQPKVQKDTPTAQQKGWAFDNIDPNGGGDSVHDYYIAASRGQRFRVTLAWDRMVEWEDKRRTPGNNKDGVIQYDELSTSLADLDLEVYEPNGLNPIFAGTATNDNLEKFDFPVDVTGEYKVSIVNNSASEAANYGLALELLAQIPGDFYPNDYIVDSNDLSVLTGQWLFSGIGLAADLFPDDHIDLLDFAVFAGNWLKIEAAYYLEY